MNDESRHCTNWTNCNVEGMQIVKIYIFISGNKYLLIMCWINWFIKVSNNSKEILDNMNRSIIHRGPDWQWVFSEDRNWKQIWLWQVRLSIIDLSDAGFQPMYYDKNIWCFSEKYKSECIDKYWKTALKIVFNWEIYNYQDLRSELIEKWYKFTSKTDTEVILASYLEWGKDCMNKFNWMWSFVIYDPKKSELFCSRDRLWKKPFFYYFDWEQFIFSSEIKWILEHKELKINRKENIDSEAIDFYFTTWYIPAPWTIYKNVKKLEARHNMVILINKSWKLEVKDECYYQLPKYSPINDKKLLIEEWKKLLEESVKNRMFTSDVPVWANLSGGLDSSSVVAEMTKRVDKEKLHTFSIWFEWKYDESKYIHTVEKAFWTKHHHEYFEESNFKKMLSDIYYYYDEPFGDYSNFPTTYVSKLAKGYVTVVLTWDWGDEIFWWYIWHKVWAQMSIIYKTPKFLRKLFLLIIPNINNAHLKKLKKALKISFLDKSEYLSEVYSDNGYLPKVCKIWFQQKMNTMLKRDNENLTQSLIDFDLLYNTMSNNYLTKIDRASMSQSIEYRSPFCDIWWINWSRKCPVKRKVNWLNTKIIMRTIINDIVPHKISSRWKQWFVPPLRNRIDNYSSELKYLLNNDKFKEILWKKWNSVIKNDFDYYKINLFLLFLWYKTWIESK